MRTSFTSREFNRDVAGAKRAAHDGPVTITDHGRRSYVLLTAEEFDRLRGSRDLMGDRLWSPEAESLELEIPERKIEPEREGIL